MSNTISIDGTEYELENMSDEEKSLVSAINFCDVKTQEVQNQLATFSGIRPNVPRSERID